MWRSSLHVINKHLSAACKLYAVHVYAVSDDISCMLMNLYGPQQSLCWSSICVARTWIEKCPNENEKNEKTFHENGC